MCIAIETSIPAPRFSAKQKRLTKELKDVVASLVPGSNQSIVVNKFEADCLYHWSRKNHMVLIRSEEPGGNMRVWRAK